MLRLVKRLLWAVKEWEPSLLARTWRWRRAVFVRRLQLQARWARAALDLDVAGDARIHPSTRVTLEPESRNRLHIGPRVRIGPRVLVQLKGGSVRLGADCELRRDTVLNVAGALHLVGENILGWGCVVHCNREVVLDRMASASEYVTIADSSHYVADPDEHFYHSVRPGSVTVGRNSWLASKATLTRNARVGDHCVVGANSVVIGSVPDGHLASGVPASTRPLRLPWADADPAVGATDGDRAAGPSGEAGEAAS